MVTVYRRFLAAANDQYETRWWKEVTPQVQLHPGRASAPGRDARRASVPRRWSGRTIGLAVDDVRSECAHPDARAIGVLVQPGVSIAQLMAASRAEIERQTGVPPNDGGPRGRDAWPLGLV